MNWHSSVFILCLLNCWMGWFYSRGVLGVEGAILLFGSEACRYWVPQLKDPNTVLKMNPLLRKYRLSSEMMLWPVMIRWELISPSSICRHTLFTKHSPGYFGIFFGFFFKFWLSVKICKNKRPVPAAWTWLSKKMNYHYFSFFVVSCFEFFVWLVLELRLLGFLFLLWVFVVVWFYFTKLSYN